MGQTSYAIYRICPEAYDLLDNAQVLAGTMGYDSVDEFFADCEVTQEQLTALKQNFHYWSDPDKGDLYVCSSQVWEAADFNWVLYGVLEECDPSSDYDVIYFSSEVPYWY